MLGSPKAMKMTFGQLSSKPKAMEGRRKVIHGKACLGDQMQAWSFLHLCHVFLHFFNPSSLPVSLSEPYTFYLKSKASSNMLDLRSKKKKMHFCGQRHTTVLQEIATLSLGIPKTILPAVIRIPMDSGSKTGLFSKSQTYLKFKMVKYLCYTFKLIIVF